MPNRNDTSPRIYYFGTINSEALAEKIDPDALVGAATLKMIGLARALRRVGAQCLIVSLPSISKNCAQGNFFPLGIIDSSEGVFFLGALKNRYLRKIVGALQFLMFSLKRVRRRDVVIIYNQQPEYILAVIYFWLRGISLIQDIEDLPLRSSILRERSGRFLLHFYDKISDNRKLCASDDIRKSFPLSRCLVVNGVVQKDGVVDKKFQALTRDCSSPLNIHFGGSLMPETGLNLFVEAVERLSVLMRAENTSPRKINFIVSGFGSFEVLEDLQFRLAKGAIGLTLRKDLSRSAFYKLLDYCHVSLSLKLPSSEFASTTFPSKIIEVCSLGLALCSTRVAGIGSIFPNGGAYLLKENSSEELASLFVYWANNSKELFESARYGQSIVKKRFSEENIGNQLKAFLLTEAHS